MAAPALRAIRLVLDHLPAAVADGGGLPFLALALREETGDQERIVQLVRGARLGPGFGAYPADGFGVQAPQRRRVLHRQHAPLAHRHRAPLLGGRVVEERVRPGAQDLERERVEAVAREHGGGLVIGDMHRRPAATQVVVVHRGQVVVDQRIDVDAFHREADAQRAVAVDGEQRAGGGHEQRTHPLAPADRGVAHRLVQAAAAVVGNSEQRVEQAVDVLADPLERRAKLDAAPLHRLRPHRRAAFP